MLTIFSDEESLRVCVLLHVCLQGGVDNRKMPSKQWRPLLRFHSDLVKKVETRPRLENEKFVHICQLVCETRHHAHATVLYRPTAPDQAFTGHGKNLYESR